MRKLSLAKIEDYIASIGGGICLMIMMLVTVISVFGRYVLGADIIPGTYNMVERIFFPLLVLLAIPITYRSGMFPKLEFITVRFPERVKRATDALVLGVELIIYLVVTWYTYKYALEGLHIGQKINIGSDRFPAYPFLFVVPFSFGLMTIEVAIAFYKKVIRPKHIQDVDVKEDTMGVI